MTIQDLKNTFLDESILIDVNDIIVTDLINGKRGSAAISDHTVFGDQLVQLNKTIYDWFLPMIGEVPSPVVAVNLADATTLTAGVPATLTMTQSPADLIAQGFAQMIIAVSFTGGEAGTLTIPLVELITGGLFDGVAVSSMVDATNGFSALFASATNDVDITAIGSDIVATNIHFA